MDTCHGRSRNFNPRAPCGARRNHPKMAYQLPFHFNPRAPCGARLPKATENKANKHFNPRAPCGARQHVSNFIPEPIGFQPTRPLRGATVATACVFFSQKIISTHAPLAGRDHVSFYQSPWSGTFQPTRPLRGATLSNQHAENNSTISTHAPLAGRDHQ